MKIENSAALVTGAKPPEVNNMLFEPLSAASIELANTPGPKGYTDYPVMAA